ncbi:MAG: class I SAM-dependent methyltransferase [Acidobacteriota bacterium]|nr:class I SAM-dependent methyltransferase [Acidobacteriota bacterium]
MDFGCGTGTDALWYAQHGYRVIAYDNSAGMIERLRIKCADQVSRGEIVPYCSDYERFLKLDLQPRPVAIVSNFAVLSLVSDLPRFFAALAGHVAPYGHAVVSALNPLFWEDMLRPWWWRSCVGSFGKGMIQVQGQRLCPRRYFPATVVSAAAPYFKKTGQAGAGALILNKSHQTHNWLTPKSLAERLERRLWKTALFRNLGQFTFLVFRRSS